jgi:hypothetical protein
MRSGKIKHSQLNLPSTKSLASEVYRCGIMPNDEAIRNILWDEEGGRWSVPQCFAYWSWADPDVITVLL